jgi:hypothetical protein
MTPAEQTEWTRRRKTLLEGRDALDVAIAKFTAAGLPAGALEAMRETLQGVYVRWLERPDLLPQEEMSAIARELRAVSDLTARMLALFRFLNEV